MFRFSNLAKIVFITALSSSVGLTVSFAVSAAESDKAKLGDREPEAATGVNLQKSVHAKEFMVAAANPYASEAGYNILKKGGSAVDAAIAVQLVLTLVEPQSSGIGGGAFILYWDKAKNHLTTFDGREIAPKTANSQLFLDKNGKAISWIKAVVGGRSVGVPGVLASLKLAHEKYGKLSWDVLFDDAIRLAEEGFIVSPRLAKLVGMKFNPGIIQLPAAKAYFFPKGQAIQAGDLLLNKPLAKVYRSLAKYGIKPFYSGWIAKDIVNAVQNSSIAPGQLSLDDMANYQPKQLPAVCGAYREFNVCGMAPPSSGGVAVIQILAQLQGVELNEQPINSVDNVHFFTQSSKLAFADRAKYIADDSFVNVPTKGLLDKSYLAKRAKLISDKDMGKALAGIPEGAVAQAEDNALELPSTSHVSIVDKQGNAVSMTTSIEMGFGSAVMVNGFLLNNQLTDFSLSPKRKGEWVANRLEPLKRPRSSMAPTMVFDQDNELKLVIGSPGGSRIINYVAQTLIAVLDYDMEVQDAINLPKVTNRNRMTTLEKGTPITSLKPLLEAKGHQVMIRDLNSGIQAIEVTDKGLVGGADPRREGKVLGQ